jgi:hypothetical protein
MDTIAALFDVLGCTPNDLIEVVAVADQVAKTASAGRRTAGGCGRLPA